MTDEIPDPCHELVEARRATEVELVALLTRYQAQLEEEEKCRREHPYPGPIVPDTWLRRAIDWLLSPMERYPQSIRQQCRRAKGFCDHITHFSGAIP